MLVYGDNKTAIAGPLDVMFIYHRLPTDTFHPVIYEESPFPGELRPVEELALVRLKSKGHHTQGAPTFAEAQRLLDELRYTVRINDSNVYREQPVPWGGQLGDVMVVHNWRRPGRERTFSPYTPDAN